MITSIARQSVILKCQIRKSVLVGNYEFCYVAGLMKKLYNLALTETMDPRAMEETILEKLDELHPEDEREKYLLHMVKYFDPLEEHDAQMQELFRWGANEQDLWQVQTSVTGS